MCSSLIGAFCGASPDEPLTAAAGAMCCMGIAGELAYGKAGHPGNGSFHAALLDAVSLMNAQTLEKQARYRET
jgi:hydroxyethylthiazole kinase